MCCNTTHRPGARPSACDTATGAATRPGPRRRHGCSSLRHGTARRAGARGMARAQPPTIRQPVCCDTAALATTQPGQGPRYDHSPRTGVCLGAQLGQLGARAPGSVFDLVFDSVLFLSHHLDLVHEHCS